MPPIPSKHATQSWYHLSYTHTTTLIIPFIPPIPSTIFLVALIAPPLPPHSHPPSLPFYLPPPPLPKIPRTERKEKPRSIDSNIRRIDNQLLAFHCPCLSTRHSTTQHDPAQFNPSQPSPKQPIPTQAPEKYPPTCAVTHEPFPQREALFRKLHACNSIRTRGISPPPFPSSSLKERRAGRGKKGVMLVFDNIFS